MERTREKRVFKCASCAHVFEQEGGSMRCPECMGKTLILMEGPSLKGARGCGGNCGGGCSCCGCH
ncbi:MAG: hypothetical protein IJR68_07495 [Fretibacterium sp.]|nr:hypothetical protein [Fretibacterium sp.]